MTDVMTDAELVERLRGFSMYPEAAIDEHNQSSRMVKSLEISSELMTQAATRIQSLTADLERAKEALRPFERAMKECGDDPDESGVTALWQNPLSMCITLGDFRRASETLKDISHD